MFKLPPLTALRNFEAAARLGSFSQAADELCVTQSAVSHQVRQLESWFGFDLFERRGRQVSLTARGVELSDSLSDAFGAMSRACRRVASRDSGLSLTIAAIPSVATCWLIPRLRDFWQAHPEIGVQLVYAVHGSRIDFSEVDIAVRYGRESWGDLRATLLFEGAAVPMASSRWLQDHNAVTAPEDLLSADLLHDEDRAGWQAWFRAAGQAVEAPLAGPIFQDFALLRAAALAGHGVALCPPSLLADDLAEGTLVQLFDQAVNADRGYYMLEAAGDASLSSQARDTFRTWLLGTIAGARG